MLQPMPLAIRPAHLLGTLLLAAAALPAGAAAHGPTGDSPAADKARGFEYAGLVRSTDPKCRGMLRAEGTDVCTHGPDPAPVGSDVRRRRTTTELTALTPAGVAGTTPGTTVAPTDGSGAVVCDGDGVTGKRIQGLYVVASDKIDRFADVRATLGQAAIRADAQYNGSARQNGAARHLRFVTAPDGAGGCTLDLRKVVVAPAGDDTFGATVDAVRAQGYNRADRKYMMWVDANVYCGIGSIYIDSQPGQANANNGSYSQYGRTDNGCWNYAEAHEAMHNLGGVQPDAPNATPNLHCTDEADEMCYDDDGSGPVVMRQICASTVATLFDCNDDDYFHAGTPPTGSYLATHWNTASSAFLINPTVPPADTTPPAVPTGLTATGGAGSVALTWTAVGDPDLAGYRVLRDGTQIATLGKVTSYTDSGLGGGTTYAYTLRAVDAAGNLSAASTVASATTQATSSTETLTGSFSKSSTTKSFTRTVAAGPGGVLASGTIQSKGRTTPSSVTVAVAVPAGAGPLGPWSGTSVDQAFTLSGGSHTFRISGVSGAKYSLRLTYQR